MIYRLKLLVGVLISVFILSFLSIVGFYIGDNLGNMKAWVTNEKTEIEVKNDELNNRLSAVNDELFSLTEERDNYKQELEELQSSGRPEDQQRISELQGSIADLNSQIETKENKVSRLTSLINGTLTEIKAEDFEGLTKIPMYFYSNNLLLTSLEIPSTITEIGSYAFQYCRNLTHIQFSEGLLIIGESAFQNCSGALETIVIPDSVTRIGASAFNQARGIKNLVIGSSVSSFASTSLANIDLISVTIRSAYIYEKLKQGTLSVNYNDGHTIKVLKTIDDGSNEYLNTSYTKSTDDSEYNTYTYIKAS